MQLRGVTADAIELGSQYPISHPYAKGLLSNLGSTPLAATAELTVDLVTIGYASLIVLARLGNATTPASATADLNQYVLPYLPDGTLHAQGLIPVRNGAVLSPGVAWRTQSILLEGVEKVSVRLVNLNAGALQGARLDYFLQK